MCNWKFNVWGRISPETKKAFLISSILTIIVHLYAFSNMILNHDGINTVLNRESTEHYIGLGRWAILPFLKISSEQMMPAVIGTLSVLYIGFGTALLISVWDIHSDLAIFLVCAMVSSFPVMVNTFCYMYTADAYFAAFALSILYVWMMKKYNGWRSFFTGIVIMAVVCAIYQAYWCFGLVLLLAVCFMEYLRGKISFNVFVKNGIIYMLNLGISLVIYYIMARLVQAITGTHFSSYQDFDRLGEFGSIKEVYWYGREAFKQFIDFYFIDGGFIKDYRLIVFNILIIIVTVILIIRFFYIVSRKWYEQIVFWILLLSIPVVTNVLSVISRNRLWPVMMIAFLIPYLLSIACCEHLVSFGAGKLQKLMAIVCCLSVFFVSFINYLTTNRIYVRMDLAYEATYSYLTKMTMRLEDYPEYRHDIPVSFINESDIDSENTLNQVKIFSVDFPEAMSVFDDLDSLRDVDSKTMIRNEKDIVDFCKTFLGFKLEIVPNEERIKMYENDEVQDMPVYPDEGSIRKIGEQIVLKLPG